VPPSKGGHMYEVRLNAGPEHLLDWDKEFKNQHPDVKTALKESGIYKDYKDNLSDFSSPKETRNKLMRGENIHEFLTHQLGGAEEAAKKLSDLGIRGIRYLDAGSRDKGRGSKNIVIFDPQHIQVKRRYAAGGGIKAYAMSDLPSHLTSDLDDEIKLAKGVEPVDQQEFTSANTSRNQPPALFSHPALSKNKGLRNIDIGGGRFEKGTQRLAEKHGIESHVFDPYNRSKEHNDSVHEMFTQNPADMATVANVLNVIKEPHHRQEVIRNAHKYIKDDGEAYFSVYEGNNSGKGGLSRDGWQENRPTSTYVDEIKKVFPHVTLSGKAIIARKKLAKASGGAIGMQPMFLEDPEQAGRRLIEWAFATAPLFHRADGGSVVHPFKNAKSSKKGAGSIVSSALDVVYKLPK